MAKTAIHSDAAPAALGPYAQAVRAGNTLYLSGQIGLDPQTGELKAGFEAQLDQVFENLTAVDKMAALLRPPYAARAAVQVAALPKGAVVELDAILVLDDAPTA